MTDNPVVAGPELNEEPVVETVVEETQTEEVNTDNSQEAEEQVQEEKQIPNEFDEFKNFKEYKKLRDDDHIANIEMWVNAVKQNPITLWAIPGDTDKQIKMRNSISKRVYPQYATWEEAHEYEQGGKMTTQKEDIDAQLNEENKQIEIYLNLASEFNDNFMKESTRAEFKEEFYSYNKTLPFEDRLNKTKRHFKVKDDVSHSKSTPAQTRVAPVVTQKKSYEEELEELRKSGTYKSVKGLM